MKARILVIEDEMAINDLLCMNLEAAGYETVGYLDGNDASEGVVQDHEFQCALVDIMLPGKDGYTLLPELKKFGIPVIFLTAKADVTSKVKGLKDGAEDYIVKPFEMLEVMVRLEKVLDRYGTAPKQIQIDDVIIDTVRYAPSRNDEEIGKSISIFLNKQKEVVRRVFLLKYFYFESNIAIAERCGFTERKVTHMLAHTRAQLKEYLIKEEIYL